jgi:hypothetical protein
MEDPDLGSLSQDDRAKFEQLRRAMTQADTERELMSYVAKFFNLQTELRHHFTFIERAIITKLAEFREIEEGERQVREAD